MAHFGKTIRSFYPRPQRGQSYEELDLSELRSPGARYRPILPRQPRPDPLLTTETAYPRAPEAYRQDPRYRILDRWPYIHPADYEPDEDDREYDAGPEEAMFDGRALNVRNRVPRERPLTYEESLRRLALLSRLEQAAKAEQGVSAAPAGMFGELEPLEPLPKTSDGADELTPGVTAPRDAAAAPSDIGARAVATAAPCPAPEEAGYGGLEQIVLGHQPQQEPGMPDAWASMATDSGPDDLSLAEQAFDHQLEGIVHEFRQQEQAFAEPAWGPAMQMPGFPEPGPPEPPDPFLQPPSAPGLEQFRF